MEKFTPLEKKYTLPLGLTGWTNSTSVMISAAYELIINIADLFNFSEDDIYKKELAKQ